MGPRISGQHSWLDSSLDAISVDGVLADVVAGVTVARLG